MHVRFGGQAALGQLQGRDKANDCKWVMHLCLRGMQVATHRVNNACSEFGRRFVEPLDTEVGKVEVDCLHQTISACDGRLGATVAKTIAGPPHQTTSNQMSA